MWWCIFYGDGSTFSNEDGSAFDAPRLDVQVIVQSDPRVGYTWVSGGDYFYLDPERGGWQTSNTVWDYLLRAKAPLVLFGRQMSDADWAKLFLSVKARYGDKQGWLVTEDRRGD